jgi:hypothetical protein
MGRNATASVFFQRVIWQEAQAHASLLLVDMAVVLYVCFSLSLDLHDTDVDEKRREQQTAHLQGKKSLILVLSRGGPCAAYSPTWAHQQNDALFGANHSFLECKGRVQLEDFLGIVMPREKQAGGAKARGGRGDEGGRHNRVPPFEVCRAP